jgi:hypothetical protein
VQFAERHGLAARVFEPQPAGIPRQASRASSTMRLPRSARPVAPWRTLQASPMLLEVGDVELRKGLTEVRELIDEITPRAREPVRRLGR